MTLQIQSTMPISITPSLKKEEIDTVYKWETEHLPLQEKNKISKLQNQA